MSRHFDLMTIDFITILKESTLISGSLKFFFLSTHARTAHYFIIAVTVIKNEQASLP